MDATLLRWSRCLRELLINPGQDEGGEGATTVAFSVNGGRTEYNNFELDGGDMMDNGSNTTLNVYPSIDAIAEFKVLTSNYGAQYGKNGSGTIEIETKSGTNQFHGDVYEFLRNDDFNATQFPFTSVPEYKKNDFGFTIGGPVYIPGHYNTNKQKTFFFWSEEWRRDLIPASGFFSQTIVPTLADRIGKLHRSVYRGSGMSDGSGVYQWRGPANREQPWRRWPAICEQSSANREPWDRFRADRSDSRAERDIGESASKTNGTCLPRFPHTGARNYSRSTTTLRTNFAPAFTIFMTHGINSIPSHCGPMARPSPRFKPGSRIRA